MIPCAKNVNPKNLSEKVNIKNKIIIIKIKIKILTLF